jgi:peptide/nickel transport system permease protein
MRGYIVKRILIMIPTMFLITVMVFSIIQMAPGRPGRSLGLNDEIAGLQGMDSGYRLFRSQFHLDLPVLFNLRFLLSDEEVIELLKNLAPQSGKQASSWELLMDYGGDIVPHLARIIASPPSSDIQKRALHLFPGHALRALQYQSSDSSEFRDLEWESRLLKKLNEELSSKQSEGLPQRMLDYYQTVMHRWDYSFSQRVSIFLFKTRFATYMSNLFKLDFGVSYVDHRPVLPKILSRLSFSMLLAILSICLAYSISIPVGVLSAILRGTAVDRVMTVVLFILYSLPSFFVGTILLFTFSAGGEYFHWFPTGGFTSLNFDKLTALDKIVDICWHLALPLICLSYVSLASLSRYARAGVMDALFSDYIKTARAKGLSQVQVVVRHALRNGMIPILTLLGSVFPAVVSGSVIIEVVFNLPGIGMEAYHAVLMRDYNMIMGIQLLSAVLTLLGILFSDLLYAISDPRIRFQEDRV